MFGVCDSNLDTSPDIFAPLAACPCTDNNYPAGNEKLGGPVQETRAAHLVCGPFHESPPQRGYHACAGTVKQFTNQD